MNKHILTVLLMGVAGFSLQAQDALEPNGVSGVEEAPAPPAVEGLEVEPLMRGPIHEAYAEPIVADSDDEEPLVVPIEPPPLVEEIAPDAKPEGARVVWIPGYWSWDDERQDFIWISGVWRKSPVGRTWLSGSWGKTEGGYQWIPGRWVPDGQVNNEPLPAPPPSLERGPTSEVESDDVFWVPGCWQFRDSRYVWRPGFWSPCHENWVWVPDHYVGVPSGSYFVSGYWDYGWDSRGVLYAPCYINRRIAYRPGFYYQPSVVVDVSGAFFHLWVRPSYCHYYFGDYYGASYLSYGFRPWYSYGVGYRYGYDPLFSYYYWNFRRDNVDFYHHMRHRHLYYQQHAAARPTHHWNAGPRSRGGQTNVALTNAQREALVHRSADRRALAVSTNQRGAIRAQVLDQHRERLRSGGDTLVDSPRNSGDSARQPSNGRRIGQGDSPVNRRVEGNVVRSLSDRQNRTRDGALGARQANAVANESIETPPSRRTGLPERKSAQRASSSPSRRASAPLANDPSSRRRAPSDSGTRARSRVESPNRDDRPGALPRATATDDVSPSSRRQSEPLRASRATARSESTSGGATEVPSRRVPETRLEDRSVTRGVPPRSVPSTRSNPANVTRSLPPSAERTPSSGMVPRTESRTTNRVIEDGARRSPMVGRPQSNAIPAPRADRSVGAGNSVRSFANRSTSAQPATARSVAPRAVPRGMLPSGPSVGGAARSPARAPAMRAPATSRGMSGPGMSGRGAARGMSGRGASGGRGRGN